MKSFVTVLKLLEFEKSKVADSLRPPSWILVNSNISINSPCGSEVGKDRSRGSKVIGMKKSEMSACLRPPSWILVNLNISINSPCGSEVGHQISKESVQRFKSYRDLKISSYQCCNRPKSKMAA
jgi:hypothetical protein